MANLYGDSAGRTGPYWRRQLGTTLPGEWTGAQLAQVNHLRSLQGQPLLGGPAPPRAAMAAGPAQRSAYAANPAGQFGAAPQAFGQPVDIAALVAALGAQGRSATPSPAAPFARPRPAGPPPLASLLAGVLPRPRNLAQPLHAQLRRAYSYEG